MPEMDRGASGNEKGLTRSYIFNVSALTFLFNFIYWNSLKIWDC